MNYIYIRYTWYCINTLQYNILMYYYIKAIQSASVNNNRTERRPKKKVCISERRSEMFAKVLFLYLFDGRCCGLVVHGASPQPWAAVPVPGQRRHTTRRVSSLFPSQQSNNYRNDERGVCPCWCVREIACTESSCPCVRAAFYTFYMSFMVIPLLWKVIWNIWPGVKQIYVCVYTLVCKSLSHRAEKYCVSKNE